VRTASYRAASLAWFAACCAGCTSSPASVPVVATDLVVVQLPAASVAGERAERLDLDARYPPGSRVIVVRQGRPSTEWPVLSEGFEAAGAPAVSPDGATVLFAGRQTPDSRWAVYEVRAHGSKPKKVIDLDRDCGDSAYLAGNRVVVACRDAGAASASGHRWSLYTTSRAGAGFERITFGVDSAFDPFPLRDGRILFSMRKRDGAALFTINPDGSMIEPFLGSHGAPATRSRPRETTDGGVVFIATDPDGAARLQRVEMRRPLATERTLSFSLDAVAPRALVDPRSAEPLADGALLLTGRPAFDTGLASTSAVFRTIPGSTELQPVFDDPAWDEVEAVSLSPVEPPRGKPSGLRPNQRNGKLILYDANRSDGVVGPPSGGPRPTALAVQTLFAGQLRTLGNVPIEADGSLFVEVPSDRPIRVRSLDARGAEISTSDWFWVRAGETRACFGCHESRESAPVNRVIRALAQRPRSLAGVTNEASAR